MSQDLLAAFGEAPTPPINKQATGLNKQEPPSWAVNTTISLGDGPRKDTSFSSHVDDQSPGDEDDFGDFEDASAATVGGNYVAKPGNLSETVRTHREPVVAAPASHRTNQIKATQAQKPVKPLPFKPKTEETKIGRHPFAGHMDILFDADDDDEYNAGTDDLGDLSSNPEAAMAYSKRLIAEQQAAAARQDMIQERNVRPATNTVASDAGRPIEQNERAAQPTEHTQQRSQQVADVLFDAEDPDMQVDDDDDWGDFESTAQEASTTNDRSVSNAVHQTPEKVTREFDLLGIDNHAPSENSIPRQNKHLAAVKAEGVHTSTRASVSEDTSAQVYDAWDDFEPTIPRGGIPQSERISEPNQSVESITPRQKESDVPPTNIPPPTVLLSIFPSLFARANDDLLNTINKLPPQQKQELLAHPASVQYLEAYLKKCVALAYIVAGRKLRWKRDQRLVQSMRIGPAAAGGRGGMKLIGVDKSEVAKEDRETVDTVRLYRAHMGKLQSAVTGATANQAHSGTWSARLIPVPNIEEQMAVKSLKTADGGLVAPRPCALCGLKRDERVIKVDKDVEDSFGEWWIEGIEMHVVCRDFWKHEGERLRGR